ncbi:MAG: glycosyltransferase family A protein [Sphingomonas fennica]
MTIFAAVIPLHNKAPYVGAAMASVLAQSHPPAEIVVVDDASTDAGPAVVEALADRRIRILRRETAGPGGYAARNLAVAQSSAPWIAFLDADDAWHPDHLEALARLIARWPDAACVATRYDHVFHDRREADHVAGPFAGAEPARVGFAAFLSAWLATGHCPLWTGALAIRRDVFEAAGGFPEGRAERGGDKDLWLRVMRLADLGFLPRSTAGFRREAAGKLTDRIDTRRLPCLVRTARAMPAIGEERRLLRRLINQEIKLYARWSARSGGRPHLSLGDLAWPASPAAIGSVVAAGIVPGRLLRLAHALEHRRRRWMRTG